MKRGVYISVLLLTLGFGFVACDEQQSNKKNKETPKAQPFLFNMTHYFSQDEFDVSFPMWFDDSLVRQHQIDTIYRTTFLSSSGEDRTIKEMKTYVFGEKGVLSEMYVVQYYEGLPVATTTFKFGEMDEYGFAEVEGKKHKLPANAELRQQYEILKKEKYAENYIVYMDQEGDYRFHVLDEDIWGPLSIDSILHPLKEDRIILGSPLKPSRSYQVENRVNEFNVTAYNHTSHNDIKTIEYRTYPFSDKRDILYDNKGNCTGFVDSTFSSQKFLTRKIATFEFEKDLPKRLFYENMRSETDARLSQEEIFEYRFSAEE